MRVLPCIVRCVNSVPCLVVVFLIGFAGILFRLWRDLLRVAACGSAPTPTAHSLRARATPHARARTELVCVVPFPY